MLLFLILSYTYTDCDTGFSYCRFNNYDFGLTSTQIIDNNTCSSYAESFSVPYLNQGFDSGICIEYRNSSKQVIMFEMQNESYVEQCSINFICTNTSTCTPENFMSPLFTDFEYTSCINTNPSPPPSIPPPSPPFPFPPPLPPGYRNSCDKYLFRETSFVFNNSLQPNKGKLNDYIIGPTPNIYTIISQVEQVCVPDSVKPCVGYAYSNHVYKQKLHNENFLNFVEKPRNFPGISNEELVNDAVSDPILMCCNLCSSQFGECGGFNVVVNETDVLCIFVSSQRETSGLIYLNYTFDTSTYHRRTFSYRNGEKFNIKTFSPSPSVPPMPSPSAPAPVIPPWYLTFLQPEIFIPSIVGGIVLLIVFVYLLRECTSERASAFSSVIDSILGRQKTEVIVA